MPYGGTTKAQDVRIERCVAAKTAQGMDKGKAIRICKASVLRASEKQGKPLRKMLGG